MRLLYLSNTRFPSERAHSAQIAHMCQGFAKNGNDVTLIVNNLRKNTGQSIEAYFGFKEKYKVERVRFGLFLMTYWKPSFVLNNFFFTIFALIKFNPVHYERVYVRDHWIAYFLSFLVRSEKIIFESHEAKYGLSVKRLIKKNVRIVCISEGIYYFYKSKGVPQCQMLVAHDAIDDSFFSVKIAKKQAREKLGIDEKKLVAMYIGKLSDEKGVNTFCKAASLLDNIKFFVIGGTQEEVSNYKSKYPDVVFLGSHDYSELASNQIAADILVIPNSSKTKTSSCYTSPLKLFAHMASGVPLLLSNVPSLTNVVAKNDSAWFEADNAQSLANQVSFLFSNLEEAKIKAEKLKQQAYKYTWDNRAIMINTFMKGYEKN